MGLCAAMGMQRVDGRVIEQCRQGDRQAFRRLFEAYKDRVYSTALSCLHGDAAAAEDVTQEAFIRVFTRIGQFRSEADFATWLYRVVIHAAIDEQRKRPRMALKSDQPPEACVETGPSAQQELERAELARAVADAIAGLKPELRLTVLLKYYEGLSYAEMAAALGCSPGTVASRLNRSHRFLARKLAHLAGTTPAGG